MTRRRTLVATLCCLLAVALNPVSALAIDGNAWLKLSDKVRAIYVAGVVDAWAEARNAVNEQRKERSYTSGVIEDGFIVASECTEGKPYDQIAAIVEKYMRDHPEKWHYTMGGSVLLAVWATCQQESTKGK